MDFQRDDLLCPCGILVLTASILFEPILLVVGIPLAASWIIAPLIAYRLSVPLKSQPKSLNIAEKKVPQKTRPKNMGILRSLIFPGRQLAASRQYSTIPNCGNCS